MKPFVKWPGGKSGELETIHRHFPGSFERYFEPFVGGGAVYWSIGEEHPCYINDRSDELIGLYTLVREQSELFYCLIKTIDGCWRECARRCLACGRQTERLYRQWRDGAFSDDEFAREAERILTGSILPATDELCMALGLKSVRMEKNILHAVLTKFKRLRNIESSRGLQSESDVVLGMETGIKIGIYTCLRELYNGERKWLDKPAAGALFYFLREYCYSSMFRYNKKGGFNVPYGGSSYNKKTMWEKLAATRGDDVAGRLRSTTLYCLDFEEFLRQAAPDKRDLVFLDPPYDTQFSTYAQNTFDTHDQERLARVCRAMPARFLLVIKDTPLIRGLYGGFHITAFDKNYMVSFQNRNDKAAEHLVITNY